MASVGSRSQSRRAGHPLTSNRLYPVVGRDIGRRQTGASSQHLQHTLDPTVFLTALSD